jgi:hypothetical protein
VKYGKGDTCALDRNKTLALITLYNRSDQASYGKIQDLLGLKTSMRKYDYNITFKTMRNSLWIININNSYVNMTFGKAIPTSGNVEKVVRIFKIQKGDFYLEAPGLNPPAINQNWWPNWPPNHPYDSGDPNGQQDRPISLSTPIDDFLVYLVDSIGINVVEFEMYITNDSSLNRNQVVKAQGEWVVKWRKNPSEPWTVPGNAFNGSTWIWNNDSGTYSYNFGSYIQGKVEQQGWNGEQIYMTIFVQNLKGNVSSSSFITFTAEPDPWIPPGVDRVNSIKLEVCVW